MKAYISRNFTEFGPFKSTEIEDFLNREILRDSDFARIENEHHWVPLLELVNSWKPKPAKAQEKLVVKPKAVATSKVKKGS